MASTIIGDAAVRVRADTSGFGRDVESGVTGALRRVAGVAAGIFASVQVGQFFKGTITEAVEAQKVLGQTQAVIKSTGGIAKVSAGDVDEIANSLSQVSGVDDEVIARGEALILTFKNIRNEAGSGNDIFNQTTQAALDMSAAMGQDLQSSVIQVGKALNDPIKGMTALRRVGVTFTAEQVKQIKALQTSGDLLGAQKIVLGELKSEFGGTAAAIATPFDKLKVTFKNLQETVGKALFPTLTKLADIFSKEILPAIAPVLGELGNLIGGLLQTIAPVLAPIAGVFKVLVDALKPVIAGLQPFFVFIGKLIEIITPFIGALLQLASQVLTALLKALEPILPVLLQLFDTIFKALQPVLKPLTEVLIQLVTVVAQLLVALLPILPPIIQLSIALVPLIPIILQLLSAILTLIAKALVPIVTVLATVIAKFAEFTSFILNTVIGAVVRFVSGAISHFGEFKDKAIEKVQAVINFFKEMPGKIKNALSGLGTALAGIFKGALNFVIKAWNRLDFSIDIKVPSWVPVIGGKGFHIGDIFPDIPLLAQGGIVKRPTLAVLGERGPEAVIPLRSAVPELARANIPAFGNLPPIEQTFITQARDERVLANEIAFKFEEMSRR